MSRSLILFFLFLFALTSCTKEDESPLPNRYVCFEIDLDYWDRDLEKNGYKIFNVESVPAGRPQSVCQRLGFGFGGIVVVRSVDNNFVPLDLACPYEVRGDVRVNVVAKDNKMVCPKCNSEFELTGEMPGRKLKGPAVYNMKKYECVPSGDAKYRVYNRRN